MNYSFIELQKLYKIIIPQIQRDYAQGRKDINNYGKIKGYDFVLKIIDVLTTDKAALNLDFIYGYTKQIAPKQFAFIPLDGQQRLTTLWLLHWYLSPKKEEQTNEALLISVKDEVKEWLEKFTYETRNSSKRFCEELIKRQLPVSNNLCETIKDANWFMASWLNDPTVVSMLNMIETIQNQNFDKEKAWENLSTNRKITFDYIDIKSDEFKLTDELYIKMNSRGKPLTSFENLKAQFSEILSAKDTDYVDKKLDYKETKVSFQEYFAFKIDSVWTDLFWKFERTQNKDISSCFMNFFIYIAQMCYFKDNIGKNAFDFKNDFSVFKKESNALFLFNTLDWLYEISTDEQNQVDINNITTFFEDLFQKGKIDNTYQGQVRLFETGGVNLFEKCLLEGSGFDNRNRIILYCLLSYAITYHLKKVNRELRYYMRVVRNLLQATRQRNEIVYNTNVRINSLGKYWKLFSQLQEKENVYEKLLEYIDNKDTDISEDALNNEREKAEVVVGNSHADKTKICGLFQLEEFGHFGGLIHNLNPKKNADKLIDWSKYVREIWSCKDDLIAAALIACNFDGVYTKECRLGEMWFWGKKDNWTTILAGQSKADSRLSGPIQLLLDKYDQKIVSNPALKPQEIVEDIIQEFLNSLTEKNWRYYFCKYKKYFLANSNYYSWRADKFEHEILGNTKSNPLLSFHINPYVKAVSNRLDNSICQEDWCYTRYSNESCLILKNGVKLYSKQNGWHIVMPENQPIPEKLKAKYTISDQNLFSETNGKDRIEIAVEFCRDLIS